MAWLVKIVLLVALGLIVGSYLTSRLMTNPPRRRGTWPLDFPAEGLPQEIISFDGTKLTGMLVPVENGKGTVIIVHGLGDCKESYAEHAGFLARNGYSVLLFDLRAHGRSGGKRSTMGDKESRDILSAIELLEEKGVDRKGVCLWGVSLGATSSLLAAVESDRVKGVIAESPFLSLEKTVAHHAKLLFRLPKFPVVHLILLISKLRTGVRVSQIDVERILPRLKGVPVFFIGGMADRRMPPGTIRKLYDEKEGKKWLWLVPDAAHCEPYAIAEEVYKRKVLKFLGELWPGEA